MTDSIDNNLDGAYVALSKLMLGFNLSYNEFCYGLKNRYVLEAHQSSKTITSTALKCGIDRRDVSDIIKNKKRQYKQSILLAILSRIEIVAKNNNMLVNKRGIDSVENIIYELASGSTTLKSIVDVLIEAGFVEDKGDKIKYLTSQVIIPANIKIDLRELLSQLQDIVE